MSGRIFATTASKAYLPGLLALARSFAEHCPDDRMVAAEPQGHPWGERWTRALVDTGVEILPVDCGELGTSVERWVRTSGSRHGHETFVKLWLPRWLDGPFWWIDSDVVVLDYIDGGDIAGAGLCCALAPHSRPRSTCFSNLGNTRIASIVKRYTGEDLEGLCAPGSLNGGLVWFDSAAFEKQDLRPVAERLLVELGSSLVRADESIFNLLGQNYGVGRLRDGLQEFVSVDDGLYPGNVEQLSAASVHFTGQVKPWMAGYPIEWPIQLYRRLLGDAWNWLSNQAPRRRRRFAYRGVGPRLSSDEH